MELKKGYKQTLAGIIPEDWEVKELHQIAKFINGNAHEMFIDEKGDYKVVNSKFVSSDGNVFKLSSTLICPLNVGDITMVMSDIPNGKALAKCFLIDQNNTYTLNQRICALTPFEDSPNYLFKTLNRNKYFLAFDSGTGQTNLRRQEVLSCPVILPLKKEQIAIADALTDADTYITSLAKLIEKKRKIKQGAMQDLLKPKDGWEEKRFNEICDLIHGHQFLSTDFVEESDGIKVVKIGNVQSGKFNTNDCDRVTKEKLHLYKKYIIKNGDILMSLTGNIGRVVIVENIKETLLQNYRVGKFEAKDIDNRFLAYCLASPSTTKQLELNSNQTSQANFGKQDFIKIKISIPKDRSTQEFIANTLYDLDSEVSLLEKKLSKAKMLKLGMMQNLLTGKIRLI